MGAPSRCSAATCLAHSALLASAEVAADAQRRDGPCARLQLAPWQCSWLFYFSGASFQMLTLQRYNAHTDTDTVTRVSLVSFIRNNAIFFV